MGAQHTGAPGWSHVGVLSCTTVVRNGASGGAVARDVDRLSAQSPIPSFEAETLRGGRLDHRAMSRGVVHLAFHRYAACPICSSKIAEFRVRHAELGAVRHVAVFHSPAEKMRRYFPETLPFEVVVDPDMEVYRAFGVSPSVLRALDPRSMLAAIAARPHSRGPNEPDGPATMIPADFLVADGVVVGAHYGRHLGDGWSLPRLLEEVSLQGLRATTHGDPATIGV